jgi:hypothetical protein
MELLPINYENNGIIEKFDGLVLRETETTRYLYIAEKVFGQPKGQDCRGYLVIQRKGFNDSWNNQNNINVASLHKGEWSKVELKTGEVQRLTEFSASLPNVVGNDFLYSNHYLLVHTTNEFTSDEYKKLVAVLSSNPDTILDLVKIAINENGADIAGFLSTHYDELSNAYKKLDQQVIQKMSLAANLQSLDVDGLQKLIDNDALEEEYQKFFYSHPLLLSLVAPAMLQIIKNKPYIGGSEIPTGASFGDFLVKMGRNNIAFIEIKRASAKLVSSSTEYRNGISSVDVGLVNAVIQTAHEKDMYYKNFSANNRFKEDMFDCKCYLIIGNYDSLQTEENKTTFELFRSQLKDIVVITYSELLDKISFLKQKLLTIDAK